MHGQLTFAPNLRPIIIKKVALSYWDDSVDWTMLGVHSQLSWSLETHYLSFGFENDKDDVYYV